MKKFLKYSDLRETALNKLTCRREFIIDSSNPPNIRLDEDVLKTPWRHLSSSSSEDVFKRNIFALAIRLQKTSSRHLQDVLVKTNIFVLAIRLQDVFKTSCKNVFKTSSRRLQDIFKTSSRHLQDLSKTFWRRLQNVLNTSCKDIFKTFSRRIIKLNCSC